MNKKEKGALPAKKEETKKPPKKLTKNMWALIITGAVLLVMIITASVILIINSLKNDTNFDYLTSDLSKYISFPEGSYKGYDLNIDIAKPHDIDVDDAILKLLAAEKGEVKMNGAMITSPVEVGPADIVHIWYRGYILDNDGKQVQVSGMSNFSSSEPTELTIGSGQFIPGFELGLVGVNTGDLTKFEKITDKELDITEDHVAYVSFVRLIEGGTLKTDGTSATCVRVDLSALDVDDNFGIGFKEQLLAAKIGESLEFSVTIDGKRYDYSSFTVDFVTECEDEPLVVKTHFPYDYSTTNLRNETAYFEVYIDGVVDYECPEFTDELLLDVLDEDDAEVTLAKLEEYEGSTLTEKYRSLLKQAINDTYEEEYRSLVEDAMWEYYRTTAVVRKYPKSKVDAIYKEYLDDVSYQFEQTGGSLENSYTGEYTNYDNIDDFAIAYLGLSSQQNKDWQKVLRTMSEDLVKERLILYYLMREENLVPTEEKFAEEYDAVCQEYIDEYVRQYLDYEEKTKEDYTDEEYAKFIEDRKAELFDYYDEEYFKETTYYEVALREFLKWPNVITLDERRAYPLDK